MDVVRRIIEGVPDYDSFMTVDELNESSRKLKEEHPDLVEFEQIGESQDGEPIYALRIGSGKKTALLYAFPHPNEPIGSLVLEYLSWKLVEDEEFRNLFDFKWIIVKAVDVVGARLNEGWFKKPYSFRDYIYNYYRPAGNKQVEWTFPIEYKTLKFNDPIPETKALVNVMESEKPDFIYSLHNAGYGGVYYYITEKAPILYPIYEKIPRDLGVPLALGEPEVPFVENVYDAVYILPTTQEIYDYYEKYSDKDPAEIIKSGDSSFGYARKFNPKMFELVTEVPYYYDERIEDLSETDDMRRDLVLKSLEFSREDMNRLEDMMEKVKDRIVVETRFQEALEYFIESFNKSYEAQRKWAETAEELNRKATVSEKFDNELVSKATALFKWGLFYRMLNANKEAGGGEIFENLVKEVSDLIDGRLNDLKDSLDFKVIPIRNLVKIQLSAGLYSMLYVRGR